MNSLISSIIEVLLFEISLVSAISYFWLKFVICPSSFRTTVWETRNIKAASKYR